MRVNFQKNQGNNIKQCLIVIQINSNTEKDIKQ